MWGRGGDANRRGETERKERVLKTLFVWRDTAREAAFGGGTKGSPGGEKESERKGVLSQGGEGPSAEARKEMRETA